MIKWLSKQWWAPVNSYGPCVGLTLWKWDRLKVELWYAPAKFSPLTHTHEKSDGEFWVIYGKDRVIWRYIKGAECEDAYSLDDRNYWKWFSVRAGTQHGFTYGSTPMIWIVVERWKPGVKVTSVSEDFKLT